MRFRFYLLIVALAFTTIGLTPGVADAHEVPTRENGKWVLPEEDEPAFDVGAVNAAPAPATASGGSSANPWAPTVEAACAANGCDPNYLLSLISCESGGVEYPTPHPNPEGGYDRGLLQIHDQTWGDIAYADGASQIWWASSRLNTVWWKCSDLI